MMTKQQLRAWCAAHCGQARRVVYDTLNGYKLAFADGSTYQYAEWDIGISYRRTEIRINGKPAYTGYYRSEGCGSWREISAEDWATLNRPA